MLIVMLRAQGSLPMAFVSKVYVLSSMAGSVGSLRKLYKRVISGFARSQDGAVLVFGLIIFVLVLMVSGLAFDVMRHEHERVRLQGTSDRAALAAGSMMNSNMTMSPEELAQAYVDAEGLGAHFEGRSTVGGNQIIGRSVSVAPAGRMNTMFMRRGGGDSLDMVAPARAIEALDNLTAEVAMVLDASTSMEDSGMMPTLRTAAEQFSFEAIATHIRNTSLRLVE